MELPTNPSVFVLLVATDGMTWLPDVLRGLRAQEHRPIDVLAVDNASTDGSGDLLGRAFGTKRVVTLERRAGYGRALAAALKVAAERDLSADAFLLIHDDAALEPGAMSAMVDAMRGGDVGIVGAKLVEWDDPRMLQDVGQTTDRYGRSVPSVERGELDQGQHEGVQDVLYATSAALLIHRTVVETVGLFDLRYVALRDDLDLCWRARLAGFRTVVTTDASVRHASAGVRDLRDSPVRRRSRYFADRNMIATLIKNYSLPHLALALPLTLLISILNAVLFLLSGRRASALQVLEALQWNVVHLPSTLRARYRAQQVRRERDSSVTSLMHHGATRLRAQIERAVEKVVGAVDEGADGEGVAPVPRVVDRIRAHPTAAAALVAAAVWVVGARTLLGSGQLAGADLAPFPGRASDLFAGFASGWRGPGAGGAAPGTPGLVLLGLLHFLCFGSAWLAQRVLLLGLPVFAGASMLRLARALGLRRASGLVAAATYAASPIVLGAFGAGRLPDLIFAAAAPALLIPLLRAAGVLPSTGWRDAAGGAAGCAVASALAPWSLAFVAGAGMVLAAGCIGHRKDAARAVLRRTVVVVGGALALLLPWSVELFRAGSPLGEGGSGPPARMTDLLGLSASSVQPVPRALMYGIAVAAVAGFVVSGAERRRTAAVFGSLSIAGLGGAWAVARGVPWIAPRPALPLVGAAVGLGLLAALAFEAAATSLGGRAFGSAQLGLGVVGIALVAQLGASAVWITRGVHPGLTEAGAIAPSFIADEARQGGAFRIAWVGGTASAPAVALTAPEGRTLLSYLVRPAGSGDAALRRVIAAVVGGSTVSGGRMLATFGVRYVIVRPEADAGVTDAVARQVDLAFYQRFRGATVYRNQVLLPVAASIDASGWVAAAASGIDAVAGAEVAPAAGPGFARRRATVFRGAVSPTAKSLVLAEDFSDGWRVRARDRVIASGTRSFGWATRFAVPADAGTVTIEWTGQRWHRAALFLQALVVLSFATSWSQRGARERGER